MFKRKVLLSNKTFGKVIVTYEAEVAGVKIPPEAIENETLVIDDELKEDGTVIKYVPPVPPPIEPEKQVTMEELAKQQKQIMDTITWIGQYGGLPLPNQGA